MRGDPSDNLEGIPGVGEKTAAKLLNQYGSLDGIFAHAGEQTPKLQANLREFEQRARDNLALMVLRRDAPVEVDFASLVVRPDDAEVKRLFEFLEFARCCPACTTRFGSIGVAATAPLGVSTEVLEAEVTDVDGPAAAASLIAGPARWTSSPPGRASPAAATSPAWPWSPTPRWPTLPGCPLRWRTTRKSSPRCRPTVVAQPQRQGADALAVGPGW